MLKEPPCITGLFGCGGASGNGGGSSSSGGAQSSVGSQSSRWTGFGGTSGSSSSSSSRSFGLSHWTGWSSRSSRSSSSSSAGRFSWTKTGTGGSLSGSAKEYIALYTITAKNKTSQWLNGVKISHGPLPQNSLFDPLRSSPGCISLGGGVECTVNLGPGESKPVSIAYQVKSSISCLLARALQSAKAAVNRLEGTATGPEQVTTAVSCSMQKGQAVAGSAGQAAQGSSSSAGGAARTGWFGLGGLGTAGTGSIQARGEAGGQAGTANGSGSLGRGGAAGGGTAGGIAGGVNGAGWANGGQGTDGYQGTGIKNTGRERLPRTGIFTDYFSPIESKSDFVLMSAPAAAQDAGLGVIPMASLGLVCTLMVALLMRGFYRLKKA